MPGSWMCRGHPTSLLSPFPPCSPSFSMAFTRHCPARTPLEPKPPESKKSAPLKAVQWGTWVSPPACPEPSCSIPPRAQRALQCPKALARLQAAACLCTDALPPSPPPPLGIMQVQEVLRRHRLAGQGLEKLLE